jgi:hypothetical protein
MTETAEEDVSAGAVADIFTRWSFYGDATPVHAFFLHVSATRSARQSSCWLGFGRKNPAANPKHLHIVWHGWAEFRRYENRLPH